MNLRWGALMALAAVVLSPAAAAAQQANGPAHIAAVHQFLLAWGHERWEELQAVAADTVTVRLGDKVLTLEPAARKADVRVVFPFRGLSTVRAGAEIKGVSVDELALRMGEQETRGPATVTLQQHEGGYRVTAVSLGAP